MAATGFTPISLYYTTTAAAVPTNTNLVAGELALNTTDGKLFYKDTGGTVQVLATKGGVGSSSTTQILYNNAGLVAGSANLTFNGSNLVLQSASASDAFRITQTGAGNAFVVEDSANPDATPFVIDPAGVVLAGFSTAPAGGYKAYISGTGFATSSWRVGDNTDGSTSAALINLSNTTKSITLAADPGNLGASTLLNLAVDGTTWATLNSSGNFGVGTTNPQKLLHANGTSGELLRLSVTQDTGVQQEFGMGFATSPTGVYPATQITALEFDASDSRASMLFYTRGVNTDSAPTERMRIDSAGNLGLGVTPSSAWNSSAKTLDMPGGSVFTLSTTELNLGQNAYFNVSGNFIYKDSSAASRLEQVAGAFNWYNAPSGTAGNVITFTQAMTLDASGNLGLGTTSPGVKLNLAMSAGAGTPQIRLDQASDNPYIEFDRWTGTASNYNAARMYVDGLGASNLVFATATSSTTIGAHTFTEKMRLDSAGNLGVGTASPSTKLDIAGTLRIDTTSNIYGKADNTSFVSLYGGGAYNAGAGIGLGGTSQAVNPNIIVFTRGSYVETARFDSAGNLGLGVTPSAWGSGGKAFQIGDKTALANYSGSTGSLELSANSYVDTGYKYLTSAYATNYVQTVGKHIWLQAPSGTAGNVITFTQAMTLDASGNLGVGTTSPSSTIEAAANVSTGSFTLTTTNTSSASNVTKYSGIKFRGVDTVGTIKPSAYIQVNPEDANYVASNMAFFTRSGDSVNERMRLDSAGNLLVGTTSDIAGNNARLQSNQTTLGYGAFTAKSAGDADNIVCWNAKTSGDNIFVGFYTEASITSRGSITYNRGAGQVAYNVTSDYRAKDIYGPVVGSGELIDSTPVYMGKMKGATQERPMFIAHEVPAYAHTGEKDAVDNDGNPVYQQMDASALIPVMWAEIQDLRKRLAAAGI